MSESTSEGLLHKEFVVRHGFRLALGVVVIFVPFLALCLLLAWMVKQGIVPSDWIPHLLLVPVIGIAAVLYLILFAARRGLQRKFLSRPALTFEEWLEVYDGLGQISPDTVRQVLTLLAQGLGGGVQPTQILATDRLKEDFVYRACGTAIDEGILLNHPLEHLWEELGGRAENGMDSPTNGEQTWETVEDIIRGWPV